MNLVRFAAACCALLLALTACGAGAVSDAAQDRLQPLSQQPVSAPTGSDDPDTGPRVVEDDLAITVSAPKLFTPTDTAFPRTARAVAFDLVIDNQGTEPYKPSRLSVAATSDGAAALQVVDSTQGYTGLMGTAEEVPPGHVLRVAVAFALPAERTEMRVTVQTDAPDGNRVTVFEGTV